jgi:ABC-type antimicrobial peptide transport system ATPase subunit
MSSGAANGHVLDLANDALTCPREATVAALWNQLQKSQVIHVRGTPTSGKSTLAQLLKEYVTRTDDWLKMRNMLLTRSKTIQRSQMEFIARSISWYCCHQFDAIATKVWN